MANINRSDIDVIVNGKQLSNVDCATLLGVEIDSKSSFNEHVEKVCKKLASRIAILRKIRACLPLKQRLQFYNSIIRPVMSYANVDRVVAKRRLPAKFAGWERGHRRLNFGWQTLG